MFAEARRVGRILRGQLRHLAFQLGNTLAATGQALQLVAQGLVQGGQSLGQHPVLAGDVIDAFQASLHRLQALWINLDAVDMPLNLTAGLVQLNRRRLQEFARTRCRGSGMDGSAEQLQGLAHAALLLLAELKGMVGSLQNVLRIGQQVLLLLQCAQFGRLQVQYIEFLHLVGQQLRAAGVLILGAGQ